MSYALWLALISAAFVALERLWPRRPDPGLLRRGIATDAAYVVFNGHFLGLLLAAGTAPLVRGAEALARALGLAGALHVGVAARLGFAAQFALAFVAIDLLKWLIHNLLHRAHPDAGPPDRNFGINLALWDWLFGTAYVPGHAPARLGFAGIETFPTNPVTQAVWPLRAHARRHEGHKGDQPPASCARPSAGAAADAPPPRRARSRPPPHPARRAR